MTSPRHERLLRDLADLKLHRIAETYQEVLIRSTSWPRVAASTAAVDRRAGGGPSLRTAGRH
ncbi:MAG: hypothetical protein H8E44_01360 [Planctomycetes bacterium]|nr:hypothetical protein [Planctomycetota bacterium]